MKFLKEPRTYRKNGRMQRGAGVVKSTDKAEIKVNPFETVTVSGFVRKSRNVDFVITEQTPGASIRIGVCPRVLSLNKVGKSQRVPIRIYNRQNRSLSNQIRIFVNCMKLKFFGI